MIEFVRWADVLALWVICWCAYAALVCGHEVRDWRSLAGAAGLIMTVMFSFAGAVSVSVEAYRPAWWASGLILSVAMVALWLYELRFGIARQLRLAAGWYRDARQRVRAVVRRWRS